jgi:uncharacterized membrane protein (UPF0127 family)
MKEHLAIIDAKGGRSHFTVELAATPEEQKMGLKY